jgi:hypothetical protein
MRTMAEQPLLPSYTDPVTTERWAVTRYGKTLDGVRVILLVAEDRERFFYTVQAAKGPELRSLKKRDVCGRFESEDDARTAILRAKIAWDAHDAKVRSARVAMREAEVARDADWAKTLKERAFA